MQHSKQSGAACILTITFLAMLFIVTVTADAWSEWQRNSDGRIESSKEKFPSGMKALGDYIHSKGELCAGIQERGVAHPNCSHSKCEGCAAGGVPGRYLWCMLGHHNSAGVPPKTSQQVFLLGQACWRGVSCTQTPQAASTFCRSTLVLSSRSCFVSAGHKSGMQLM